MNLDISNEKPTTKLRDLILHRLELGNYDQLIVNRSQAVSMNDWSDINYRYEHVKLDGVETDSGTKVATWSGPRRHAYLTTIFGDLLITIKGSDE